MSYYQDNKDKILEYKHSFYQQNSKKILEKKKEYYQKNKDKKKEYMKNYYQKNKEKIYQKRKPYVKKYRQKNRERILEYGRKRYRKILEQWLQIIKEHYGKIACCKCGYKENFFAIDFHHRDPKTKKFRISFLLSRKPTPERIEKFKKELGKCDLLCKICHTNFHGFYPISN